MFLYRLEMDKWEKALRSGHLHTKNHQKKKEKTGAGGAGAGEGSGSSRLKSRDGGAHKAGGKVRAATASSAMFRGSS
jgi:hypothetical protein